MILTKSGSIASLSIPDHRELAPGTLRKLICLAGVSVEQFRVAVGRAAIPAYSSLVPIPVCSRWEPDPLALKAT